MAIGIGRRDRPDIVEWNLDEAKWRLSEEGFTAFPENVRGWKVALLNPELAEYAVRELGYTAESIAEELGYKLKAVEKVLAFHGIVEEDETTLTEFEYRASRKWNPTESRPHPRTVYRAQGTPDKKPEGWV